jgi:hypothetical protein
MFNGNNYGPNAGNNRHRHLRRTLVRSGLYAAKSITACNIDAIANI